MRKFNDKAVKTELYLAFSFLYMRIYGNFTNLLEFLINSFPNPQNGAKLSLIILELLEILADVDNYDKVVIEETNKEKYFLFLSKELKANCIMLLNQSCMDLTETPDDQKYKYLVCELIYFFFK